jgi:protein-tyrosine phosphatase
MIDLHCHILPGLDDGAVTLEDSVAMARQAQADGISVVVATPHIRGDHAVVIDELGSRVRRLQRALNSRKVPVRVLPGGELAQTRARQLSEEELRLITLGAAGTWLLLEPAPGPLGPGLCELVEWLTARGLSSVIAHPERHAGERFAEQLLALQERGCLIQWTADFVARASDGDEVLRLAGMGLVHLLGSDSHSARIGRPVRLGDGFDRLARACSPEWIEWMTELAPRAILSGEPAPATPPPA